MIAAILGGKTAEKVMLYMQNYSEGYASAIAQTFSINLSVVQKQLQKFERAGVFVSQLKGKTRVYSWNPRYPFTQELQAFLQKALLLLPVEERKQFFTGRTRPRRTGKPL